MKAYPDNKSPLSEINVVPLVDVMLVLLIIFMITAPMMQQGLSVELPKVTSRPLPSKEDVQVLTITRSKALILNDKNINEKDLKSAVEFLFARKTDKEIFLKADSGVPYGFVVHCMAAIRQAGIDKVNIVTKPTDER
jgi:biopolymer transport protein TolR